MGARGAVIMGFFGGVFAALTMYWQWHFTNGALVLPFIIFATIGLIAAYLIRLPGRGVVPSDKVERVIIWSSIAEGIGLFLASTIVVNLHRLDWRLPAIALVVGLHFLPIALAASFRPFHVLGAALIVSAVIGFVVGAPAGGEIAGIMAAISLWTAALLAVHRDWRAKRGVVVAAQSRL